MITMLSETCGLNISKITYLNAADCFPPHRVTHINKFEELTNEFKEYGWSKNHPPLIGYFTIEYGYQLISGSHRYAAAKKANIKIPVLLQSYAYIKLIWGSDSWANLLTCIKPLREYNV